MKRFLLIAVLCLFSLPAKAATYLINLNDFTPIGRLYGPCYCGSGPVFQAFSANPGDIFDFGSVTLHGGLVYTPDSPPPHTGYYYTPAVSVSFDPMRWPQSTTGFVSSEPTRLLFTVPEGAHSIQIGAGGWGEYLAPGALAPAVPEMSTWLMMILGFAGLGLFKMRHSPLFHSRSAS